MRRRHGRRRLRRGSFCAYLKARGWLVRGLVRDPTIARVPGVSSLHRAVLPDGADAAAFAGADVVVHRAWATGPIADEVSRRVNVQGSLGLRDQARAAGVERFVFVSSLAANADAESV